MTTASYRDTQFRQLVRFLSGKGLFQYPDEANPSLWAEFVKERDTLAFAQSSKHSSDLEKPVDSNQSADVLAQDSRVRASSSQTLARSSVVEDVAHVHLVDWYGPDDPENPQNWPSSWKLFVGFQICLLNFSVYIASSIYVAGEKHIMQDFGVSQTVATLGLSFFSVGYGFGPMLWSPMSEMPTIGRNVIYFWTLLFFVLLQLPTGFAVNMAMFLVFRVLTGFLGSPSLATGGATISDMYDPALVAYGITIWGSFGICGPVFGPIIGGFVAPAEGWRWTIWVIAWLNAAVLILLFFFLPETSAANILYKRAKRLRKMTGDHRLRSQSEIDAAHQSAKDYWVVLGRAFTLTFSEPIVFFMDLYTALLYGVLFTWFESFPLVFGGVYEFSPGEQGLVFLGIFIGGIVTLPLFLLWIKLGVVPKFSKSWFRPEMVLPPTFFGSVSLPICLFWYGWSAQKTVPWIVPVIGSSFFTVAIITLFNPVLNYLGIAYPTYAASVFAGNALFRASFGAIFPLFARQLFDTLGIGPGNSLLGGISIGFIPLPLILYNYGMKIRHMSKMARHDM